ncbi:hypothetical protein VSR34_24590 [Paraburkholderia sp. JHI2823]|uniref:hypothetical protein n=1 Tax=Paraburkholderia sp. JHI2823 TaxID=3112960 RepID=UPI00316C8865
MGPRFLIDLSRIQQQQSMDLRGGAHCPQSAASDLPSEAGAKAHRRDRTFELIVACTAGLVCTFAAIGLIHLLVD